MVENIDTINEQCWKRQGVLYLSFLYKLSEAESEKIMDELCRMSPENVTIETLIKNLSDQGEHRLVKKLEQAVEQLEARLKRIKPIHIQIGSLRGPAADDPGII